MGNGLDSLVSLAASLLILGGAAASIWAIFGDRHKGTRRCQACWYEMTGVPGLRCPECGTTGRDEAALMRTRRRWRQASAGALACVLGYGAIVIPNAMRGGGLLGAIPTTALLLVPMPPDDADDQNGIGSSAAFDELWRRHSGGRMWGWQRTILQRRDLARVIAMRDSWPSGQPLCVRLGPGWFASANKSRIIRVVARLPGARPIEHDLSTTAPWGSGGPLIGRYDYPHTLVPLPEGTTEVVFDVEVVERDPLGLSNGSVGDRTICEGVVEKPVRVVPGPEYVMRPVESAELTQMLADRLEVAVNRARDGSIMLSGYVANTSGLEGVTLGLGLEFLLGEEVVATAWVRPGSARPTHCQGWTFGDMERVITADPADSRWRLRVRDMGASAVRDFRGSAYWKGEFEGPLSRYVPAAGFSVQPFP